MIPTLFCQNALQQALLNSYYYTEDGVLRNCRTDKAVSCARVRYEGKLVHFKLHRAIFAMHHGWLPAAIDHINRDRFDNRISNLRPTTTVQNSYNKGIRSYNSSGYVGVHSCKVDGQIVYNARINANRVCTNLGNFPTAVQAFDAYYAALVQKAGEFAPPRDSLIADWVKKL